MDKLDREEDRSTYSGSFFEPHEAEDLMVVIADICRRRDEAGLDIDADEVVKEIESDHWDALKNRATSLARKHCRKLVTDFLRRQTSRDEDDQGPQIALPGFDKPLPSHITFMAGNKLKHRLTLDATLEQHKSSLAIKDRHIQYDQQRRTQQQRVVDLLESSGRNSLREWQQAH